MAQQEGQQLIKAFTTRFEYESHTRGDFNDAAALELAIGLRDNHILENIHLDVKHLTRESEGVTELGKSLSQLSNLNTVRLCTTVTSETTEGVANLLLGCLGQNENVKELFLVSVLLSEGFVKFLLSNRPRPLKLHVSDCTSTSDPQKLKVISSAIRDSNVQSLYLSRSPRRIQNLEIIEFASVRSLGVLLPALQTSDGNKPQLRHLDLDFGLWESAPSSISGLVRDFLLQNRTVEYLHLRANLNHASLRPLAEGIRGNDSLKELDLACNDSLTRVGHLMPALMQRPKSLRLNLSYTSLRDHGVNEISEALEGQVRIEELDFDLVTGTECTTRFFRSLAINEHLVGLILGELDVQAMDVLIDTIGSFTALQRLHFGWPNQYTSTKAEAARGSRFLEAMKQTLRFYPYRLSSPRSIPARSSGTLSATFATVTVGMKWLSGPILSRLGFRVTSCVAFCPRIVLT